MRKIFFDISLIIPVFNEKEIIRETYDRVTNTMSALDINYELIFVDDGSTDGTGILIQEMCKLDKHAKSIRFSRNFGHQPAITAGLNYASGQAVITMDADLQHPPELIPGLIQKWREGYEVVYTVREYGDSEGYFKKITSSLFYKIINKLIQIEIPTYAADFKLYDRKVVDSLNSLPERTRFLRGLSAWVGFNQVAMPYKAEKRKAGVSKYTPRKMVRFALDGITSFSIVPLKLSIHLGFLVSGMSFSYLCYVFYMALFTDHTVQGWASTTAALLWLGGVQLIAIGILGEYIGRIYEETKGRPPYIITMTSGFNHDQGNESM